jgi:hypothetical protein
VAFFFDNLLPIPDLSGLTRDAGTFPKWSSSIGVAMRSEVQRVLEYEIFENTAQAAPPYAAGSWPAILTAPYTFVNGSLFSYYGSSTFASGTSSVTGTTLTKVNLNTSQRLGLLTLGGNGGGLDDQQQHQPGAPRQLHRQQADVPQHRAAGGVHADGARPLQRQDRARALFEALLAAICSQCHQYLDPLGFPFENYDAVGQYRASEKWTDPATSTTYDTPIDASGAVPGVAGSAKNAVELVQLLATSTRRRAASRGTGFDSSTGGRSPTPTAATSRRSATRSRAPATTSSSSCWRSPRATVSFTALRNRRTRHDAVQAQSSNGHPGRRHGRDRAPWLEAMGYGRKARAQTSTVPLKRLVTVYQPGGAVRSGANGDKYTPTGSETSFTLSPILAPLQPMQSRIIVVDGLNLTCGDQGKYSVEQHQGGSVGLFTGAIQQGSGNYPAKMYPSIDQVLASGCHRARATAACSSRCAGRRASRTGSCRR